MIRALILLLLVAIALVVAATFAWLNPQTMSLDLAFGEVEITKAVAMSSALAIGWVLGWLSTAAYVLKLINDKRRLAKQVRVSKAELDGLRSLPSADTTHLP